jgi:hypothetical protein
MLPGTRAAILRHPKPSRCSSLPPTSWPVAPDLSSVLSLSSQLCYNHSSSYTTIFLPNDPGPTFFYNSETTPPQSFYHAGSISPITPKTQTPYRPSETSSFGHHPSASKSNPDIILIKNPPPDSLSNSLPFIAFRPLPEDVAVPITNTPPGYSYNICTRSTNFVYTRSILAESVFQRPAD